MKGKVDVKKLISQLTLEMYEQIFKELNIPVYSKCSTHWVLYTACHNKDPYSGSPKLYWYLDTKMFVCYTSCASAMNLVTLVMKRLTLLGKDGGFLNAINTILSITGLDPEAITRINSSKYTYDWEADFGKFIRFKNGISELPIYDKSILPSLTTSLPQQWIDEGISIETMQKYQIGYYERLNCTTIPCFNRDGELIGIRTRNWQPELIEEKGKYYPLFLLDGSNYAFPTNNVFYGINFNWLEIERTKTCFIGESEKFVLKMDTWFGRESTALAMHGNNLGMNRRNQLLKMGVERVIYVPDNDYPSYDSEEYDKWVDKTFKFAEQFKGYCQVEIVTDSEDRLLGYKDNATDGTKEIWDRLYAEREIVNFNSKKYNDWLAKNKIIY